jgi:integrase
MRVKLKGIHKVSKKLADGSRVAYYYAWRGGPRLEGKLGSPEFVASFQASHSERRQPTPGQFFALISEYRQSTEFDTLATSTKRDYLRILKVLETDFGDLPIAALNDPAIRGEFKNWRDDMRHAPRAADYRATVLARVLAVSHDNGRINHNYAAKLGRLYKSKRASLVWSEGDLARIIATSHPTIVSSLILALSTGQRQGDLLGLTWSAYDGYSIRLEVNKTSVKGSPKKRLTIPLLPSAIAMLNGLERTSTHILTNQRGTPWTEDGFRTSWGKAVKKAFGDVAPDLHFNDLRGTAITRLRIAGSSSVEIASITGHSEKTVEQVLNAHYLGDQTALAERTIARLAENEPRLKIVN